MQTSSNVQIIKFAFSWAREYYLYTAPSIKKQIYISIQVQVIRNEILQYH